MLASTGLGPELASDHNVIAGLHTRHTQTQPDTVSEEMMGFVNYSLLALLLSSALFGPSYSSLFLNNPLRTVTASM